MRSFDVENGMLREPIELRHDHGRDCDENVTTCDYCDGIRNDSQMSDIDGMCENCYYKTIKAMQQVIEAQDDEVMLTVFNHLTEV